MANNIPEDLAYIVRHVKEWPDEALYSVRLDADGEICFIGNGSERYDFFPGRKEYTVFEGDEHPCFQG